MRTIWQSLAWKEWHEHKWKLAAVTAIMTTVAAAVLIVNRESTLFEGPGLLVMLVYGMAPLTLFLGAREAASERTRGTLHFTQSLPVPMWKVAMWKLTFGLTTCISPILTTLALLAGWYLCRSPFDEELVRSLQIAVKEFPRPAWLDHDLVVWVVAAGVVGSTVVASLFLWTVAIGVNRKSEVRAGATALLVCVVWWCALVFCREFVPRHGPDSITNWLAIFTISISPGLFPASLAFALFASEAQFGLMILVIAAALVAYMMLAAWFICRYGLPEASHDGSRRDVAASDRQHAWLGPPRRSPFAAILWKQFRESGPIVLVGLAAIACFFLGNVVMDPEWYANSNTLHSLQLLTSITFLIGFLISLIAGISSFDEDLSPALNDFWRSRPIHPDLWFWTKYLTGLLLIGLALYLPVVIAYWLTWKHVGLRHPEFYPDVAIMMLCIHVAIYAAATATIVVIRQQIYAAILAVGALLFGIAIVRAIWEVQAVQIESIIYGIEFAAAALAALATLVAWFAVRYHWGRTSRF